MQKVEKVEGHIMFFSNKVDRFVITGTYLLRSRKSNIDGNIRYLYKTLE